MVMTRRRAAFRDLAEAIDAELQRRGFVVDTRLVDAVINDAVERNAELLGLSVEHTLRVYFQEDWADVGADAIENAINAGLITEAEDLGEYDPRRTLKLVHSDEPGKLGQNQRI